jgi:hypothetical protein
MVQWIERGDRARRIAAGYLGVVFAALLVYGWYTEWFPWSAECYQTLSCHMLPGETYGALEQAWGALHFGIGTSWLLLMHHYVDRYLFYIHNQNFGAYLIYITAWIGAETVTSAAIITAGGFVVGLGYGYVLVERMSRSSFLALAFLTLFILDVYSNTMLGLNLLRAWHSLALFGVAYHALDLFAARRARWRDIGLVFLLAWIGFALGYEFYAFVVCTAVVALLISGFVRPSWRWVLFGTLLFLPFVIRQIQVMGGVGPTVWALDLFYTAGTKSPLLRSILPHPPVEDVLQWYTDNHLFHGVPNNQPISAAFGLFMEKQYYLRWLGDLGPFTIIAATLGLGLSLVLAVRGNDIEARCARAVITIAGGQILGFLIFGYHALLYFVVVFNMPLIISMVYLSAAFLVTMLVRGARPLLVRETGVQVAIVLVAERLYLGWVHLSTMEVQARPHTGQYMHIGTDDFVDPGGLLGNVSWITLTLAALVYGWVLWRLWCVFLQRRAVDAMEPELPMSAVAPAAVAAQ